MECVNFQGDRIPHHTVFILKHRVTGEYLAVFSTREIAMANRYKVIVFDKDETFIQETIIDYYAVK